MCICILIPRLFFPMLLPCMPIVKVWTAGKESHWQRHSAVNEILQKQNKQTIIKFPHVRLGIAPSAKYSGRSLEQNERGILQFLSFTHVYYSRFRMLSYLCIETRGTEYDG